MSEDLQTINNTQAEVSESAAPETPLDAFQEESPELEQVDKKNRGKLRKVLAVIFIILVLLLCGLTYLVVNSSSPSGLLPTGGKDDLTWIRSIYGYGDAPSQLTNPSSVAIDPSNSSFWMSDPGSYRIVNYRLDGTLLGIIGKPVTETGAFRQPARVFLDPEGNIYVIEVTYEQVRVFDKSGNELGQLDIPGVQSVAANSEIMVFGATSGFVIMDKDANVLNVVGTHGKGEGQFDRVNGIALDDESNIYAVDTFNNRISKYDKTGKQIWIVETGHPGNQTMTGAKEFETKAPANLQVPMGCTLDGNGNLVVMDMLGFSVAVLDSENGDFIAKYGKPGNRDGEFMYPSDITYDKRTDSFVIADTGMKRAQVIKLPSSGGNLGTDFIGLLQGPLLLCLIPILLLIIALIIAYFMSRSRKNREAVLMQKYAEEMLEEEQLDSAVERAELVTEQAQE